MRTLFREDLDATGCETPDCNHDHSIIYLHSRCHPRKGYAARYEKASGILRIECAVCERAIAEVAVAKKGA